MRLWISSLTNQPTDPEYFCQIENARNLVATIQYLVERERQKSSHKAEMEQRQRIILFTSICGYTIHISCASIYFKLTKFTLKLNFLCYWYRDCDCEKEGKSEWKDRQQLVKFHLDIIRMVQMVRVCTVQWAFHVVTFWNNEIKCQCSKHTIRNIISSQCN